MRRIFATLILMFCLLGSARGADIGDGRSPALNMMATMWEFMEWFLGRPEPLLHSYSLPWRDGYPIANWYDPYTPFSTPYRHLGTDYSWRGVQSLDGVWLAQSGEYWLLRGNRFHLYVGPHRQYRGELWREGNFLRTRLPWGEYEFEYRQMNDMLMLLDVEGRVMWLRRVERGDWRW